jgi:nucleoid-associated protein YgaU
MKPHTLPVKRRPVQKGILHRLSAVTKNRRQRVAATASAAGVEMDSEDGGSKISRALTIIFLIHIVAIGLIFIHQRFLDGRSEEGSTAVSESKTQAAAEPPATVRREDLPRFASGEKPYIVRTGDNYARIAAAEEVDEGDLRALNRDMDISTGLILKIPPKRIVAVEPPEVIEIRQHALASDDRGLVEALPVDVANAPRAQLVRPNRSSSSAAGEPSAASGTSYVVKSGDSIYRIATKYKVNQDDLMRANQITDPRKMKIGMTLRIP